MIFHSFCFWVCAAPIALAQNPESDPYAPTYTACPEDLSVRRASEGLSALEKQWRQKREATVLDSLPGYLRNAKIQGLDVEDYVTKLNVSTVPIVGLSISGGGSQSAIGGLGIWQAFDARYPPAVSAGTGGLAQITSYLSGLSGGGAFTVAILAANNFESIAVIANKTNFNKPYDNPTGNQTEFFEEVFEKAGAKADLGFPVSVADPFGQWFATWLPKNWTFASYSDIAQKSANYSRGAAPMPTMVTAEVVPGKSPEIGEIMYAGANSTNRFDLTSYEVTPFEFGSWAGGRVQAFLSTEWQGTAMDKGKPQNTSQCVNGFDKMSFIQGSTTDAYNAYLIDDFYNIPIFAKREIPIPQGDEDIPVVELVNQTAEAFSQTFNQSIWATYPNPFRDYSSEMEGITELLITDGSLTGETNPIRPQIIPERGVDFLVVYEASSEAEYNWVNGTTFGYSAQAAELGNIPFPKLPSVNTIVNKEFNTQPTFFGCNETEGPLVLWLPNSPWSGYSNFSYTKASFSDRQLNDTFENAFQLATYGNITQNWGACLACAAIHRSLKRLNYNMPDQCAQCFHDHCWDGKEDDQSVTMSQLDLRPRLDTSLSYSEWEKAVWNNKSRLNEESASEDAGDRAGDSSAGEGDDGSGASGRGSGGGTEVGVDSAARKTKLFRGGLIGFGFLASLAF